MAYLGTDRFIRKTVVAPILCALALAGCDEGFTLGEALTSPTSTSGATETIETDVIAPEAFSITDSALWDGRPTFGGVWVAHPDAETPERVRIRNIETGKEVIGALYKRERDFPGPKIELSADAASALGVLAGNPTQLSIATLRRRTVVVEVPPEEITAAPEMATPVLRPAAATPAVEVPVVPAPTPTPPAPEVSTAAMPTVTTSALPAAPEPTPEEARTSVYIQVATMQSRNKAEDIVSKMITAGLFAEIRERETSNRTLYRVIVGPAKTPEALEIMMSVVHEIGYKDAIVLR